MKLPFLSALFQSGGQKSPRRRHRPRCRPGVDRLEGRQLLSVLAPDTDRRHAAAVIDVASFQRARIEIAAIDVNYQGGVVEILAKARRPPTISLNLAYPDTLVRAAMVNGKLNLTVVPVHVLGPRGQRFNVKQIFQIRSPVAVRFYDGTERDPVQLPAGTVFNLGLSKQQVRTLLPELQKLKRLTSFL